MKMHKMFSGKRVQELSSPVPHGQSQQFSLSKNYKSPSIYNLSFKVLKNYYPHAKASGQLDISFENESTMCKVIAVMIAK